MEKACRMFLTASFVNSRHPCGINHSWDYKRKMWVDVIVNFRFQGHFQGHKSHQGQKCFFHKFIYLGSLLLQQKHANCHQTNILKHSSKPNK